MELIFDQLTISPLMVVLLLLYGLLIAFVLVLWTALDLKRKKGAGPEAAAAPAEPKRQAQSPVPARSATAQVIQDIQPEAKPGPTRARRAADSDSVVSYSVRPRVDGSSPDTAPDSRPEPVPVTPPVREVERPPDLPARTEPPASDRAVGRSSRQPASEDGPVRTMTARRQEQHPPERDAAPAVPERRKSEDAFERFLRGTADEDDF